MCVFDVCDDCVDVCVMIVVGFLGSVCGEIGVFDVEVCDFFVEKCYFVRDGVGSIAFDLLRLVLIFLYFWDVVF